MERVNKIFNNSKYKYYLSKNNYCERERIFCKHNLEHFLDVARIAYIMSLEENLNIPKEIIYATSLLHDIGRWVEYEEGESHEKASYRLSKEILDECGFNYKEKEFILGGISNHRNKNSSGFNKIMYLADKKSRACFLCEAEKLCKWSKEKKNLEIMI
ncbi:HD domain-containing protein [Clostridium sp.]|uniref:HD domain-containing protein n=1 Tax=Clostridium sp. TaxID=1506 RepID=UPI002605E7B6|nr:HD domain-containing protein [Clostridium sp.]